MYETVLQPDSAILDWCIFILNLKNVAHSQQASKTAKVNIFPCTQI